ncbi:MAG: hypothetical protein ACRC0I_02550 [Sediminibacterium sp.]|nr:hypothetical protein [Chitinophagaceae bacterium]MCA6446085.1 hypothetical protein [Chitinophagaceae bacterium]
MTKQVLFLLCLVAYGKIFGQDTTVVIGEKRFTLSEVVVRNNFDYKRLLAQIKEDTSFYKAFRNLRVLGFSAYNSIEMLDKKGAVQASLLSKTKQNRVNGCRTMEVLEEKTTGDFYDAKKNYNYTTPELYASLFFTKGTICGEDNIVKGRMRSLSDKKGMDKHKEQLKMLFFNPGKKIPGIPFIGDKLDLYDDRAHRLYDYRLDIVEFKGTLAYVFSITPKENLSFLSDDKVVVDQMVTWFDMKTLEVLARNYSLSYKAGVYDFDVNMEVEMTRVDDLLVPKVLRYKGNWGVIFKKRERAVFTATLFDFRK